MQFEFHPLANLFPLIEGKDLDELAADIKANGIAEPIAIYQGKILDGRNRYRATTAAGIEIEKHDLRYFRPEIDGDPLKFVISKNLKRRHLNESQRAFVAAKIANFSIGSNQYSEGLPIGRASEAVGASTRSAARAREVLDHGAPELQRAVERGHIPVSTAAELAGLPVREQKQIVEAHEPGQLARRALAEIKKAKRSKREQELGERQQALPEKKFGVVLCDPEWNDEVWSEETGMDRHAANHYPTSSGDVIASRPVAAIAAKDCVLFMWVTNQHLRVAMTVMEAWGFEYKSNYCWGKDRISLGRWQRGKHELLLIGTRGRPPCPAPGTQWESLQLAPKGKHSEKPECFLEMIESYFPTLPKIELNRRGPARPGWDAWGNESLPPHDPITGEIAA